MAGVTWNDHIDVVEEGGVTFSKTEEFTVAAYQAANYWSARAAYIQAIPS